jgi:hypothetical protein
MARVSTATCEPFRAWNRLEPRARKEDFDKNLQAGVHDALWFLTRQWQFGEFQGEDTGSAIFAKLLLQTTQLSHYKAFNDTIVPYSDLTPLEETVEQTHAPLNDKTRILSGKYFRKILVAKAVALVDFQISLYNQKLKTIFKYQKPAEILPEDTIETLVSKAKLLVNTELVQFATFFSEDDFDGFQLYLSAKNNLNNTVTNISLKNTHNVALNAALTDYIEIFEELYSEELNQIKGAWNPRQLEYQFKCLMPEENNTKTILTSEEYYTGELDWYSFDIDNTSASKVTFKDTVVDQNLVKNSVMTVIPTEARFSGMPNSRWWQFEDGAVDLANFKADTTDIANMVFSEYAFMYSNDWHIIPIPMEVGTLAEIKGIVVKDVFGEREYINSASQGSTDNWTSWGMYNLSTRLDVLDNSQAVDTRLFMPPSTMKTHESKPIEHVHFLRDEMANMVWGIETRFDNGLGKGADGHILSNELKALLEKLSPPVESILAEGAVFEYILGNSVPENWIPFIPVHLGDGLNRAIQFQRAAMPRTFKNNNKPIRPTTTLLRIGVGTDKAKPYFINEEEIPKAGTKVMSTYQRTRWYNGKVVSWYGNRKTLGRGEGSSGLQFDQLRYPTKAKS